MRRLSPQRESRGRFPPPSLWLARSGFALALGAALLWRNHEPGWGPLFWAWSLGLAAFVLGLPRRSTPSLPSDHGFRLGLGGILLLAAAWRLPGVHELPANISVDEILPGVESLRLASGKGPNPFGSIGWFSIPNLSFLPGAIAMALLPWESFHSLRISSAVTGLAGLAATACLGRQMLGRRAALWGTFLMAVSFWHLHNSRTGFPYAQSSFGPPLALALLWAALSSRQPRHLALAGMTIGLALQLYFPSRILLLLVPTFLAFLLSRSENSGRLAGRMRDLALVAAGVVLLVAPLLLHVGPRRLQEHSSEILITRPATLADLERRYQREGFGAVFEHQLVEATRMFTEAADVAVLNRSPAGLLDPLTLGLFLLGVTLALLHGRPPALLLVGWVGVTLVFGVTLGNAPRSSYRLAAALPAVFLLAGFTLDRLLTATEPASRPSRILLRPVLLGLLALAIAHENHRRFFADYALGDGHEVTGSAVMRYVSRHCEDREFVLLPAGASPFDAQTAPLFCPNQRPLEIAQVPTALHDTTPTTILLLEPDQGILDRLRACFPRAPLREHHAPDGRWLFASVEASRHDVAQARKICPLAPAPTRPDPRRRRG